MRRLWLTILLFLCSPVWSQTLVASVEPLAKVLRSLYGPEVEILTLMEANQNPHQLALSPRQVLNVQQADLVVWLGEAAEPPLTSLLARRDKPSLAVLDLPGVQRRETGGHPHAHDEADHHDGAEHGAHENAWLDPHLWLSVDNMRLLAATLGERFPAGMQAQQPAAWQQATQDWLARQQAAFAPFREAPWLSYHHPWGYLTDSVDLAEPLVVTEQLDAGPGSRRFVSLAEAIREQQVRCAIQEPEARANLLKRLCPDCYVQPLDPLGRDYPELDYLPWLTGLAEGLRQCLKAASQ
ncbi:MAG: zinc ABC transporter substrate-binding protein [Pseudomonadales bacterium]|nr:zinc ABC transporter substrate-binding protein [Pseudomonadales bacterium]